MNAPEIELEFKNGNSVTSLKADKQSNQISTEFDFFVINNQLVAKGTGQNYGGRNVVSASMNIETITLVDTIPEKIDIGYSFTEIKQSFGVNGKVLPNITSLLSELKFAENLKNNLTSLDRANNSTIKQKIDDFISSVNSQVPSMSKETLHQWIETTHLSNLITIQYFSDIANLVKITDFGSQCEKEAELYLSAWQIITIYHKDKSKFKKHLTRMEYELDKTKFDQLFSDFNTTWIEDFKPKKSGNSLVLEFPKAHLISNGQRDILCFISLLERAYKKLKKENCILIIDEVFDYLDDANLIAAQYYITQFIEKFKQSDKKIYPLILTHLDPVYFKGYVFSSKQDIKIHYLEKSDAIVDDNLKKILRERNNRNSSVKKDIEKYLLHYHVDAINRRSDFKTLNIAETWGEGSRFDDYIYAQAQKYCNNESSFDPFAVCCAVRKKIEEKVYQQIPNPENQSNYLNNEDYNGTNNKLDFAESVSVIVNETYYLLGIIYNDALHWKDDRDNISPVMSKLRNQTIKKLIKTVLK